jgi:hypothetical protein
MKGSYDEDRVLTNYVWQHYRHLFTEFERRVADRISIEIKTQHSPPEIRAERLARLWGPPDATVNSALEQGHWAFLDRVRTRILAEEADRILTNRCPMCERIVRTPKARQCLWCHHDWHAAT